MKLYTRNQFFIAIVITALLVGTISVGVSVSLFRKRGTNNNTESALGQTEKKNEDASSVLKNDELDITPPNALTSVTVPFSYTSDEAQNISVYEKCNEAVVNINTQVTGYNWFLEPVAEDGGSGSGSIIDARGYVITNVHVIEKATKIYISLHDGSQYEGKIVGSDVESDIAVLKFDPPKGVVLKTITFGDSTKLKVGQKVIAIGNPFGFERTMTTGIVSALGRPIKNSNNVIIRDMVQTDASINPGNSGGPLLDTQGHMVGINTMIYSSSGSSSGIGFAVPASTARRVVSDILQYGKVKRGALQASLVQMNRAIADYARLDINYGLLVSQVKTGGNAEKAGIKGGTMPVRYNSRSNRTFNLGGDIIVAINGVQVATLSDYFSLLESKRPGDVITVTLHRNRKNVDVSVTLQEDS